MKKPKRFTDQLRAAIRASDMSRYKICQKIGYHQPGLTRFMAGNGGLSVETIDQICELLGARLVVDPSPTTSSKKPVGGK